MHLFSLRRVLDELYQRVLEHHRTFGHGKVPAHFEGTGRRHRNVALLQIAQQVLQTAADAFTFGAQRGLDEFRVGGGEIGWRHRLDHLFRQIAHAILRTPVGHRRRFDAGTHELRVQQIGLTQIVEIGALGPLRGAETAVGRFGVHHRGRRTVVRLALGEGLPEPVLAFQPLLMKFGKTGRFRCRESAAVERRVCGQRALLARHEFAEVLAHRGHDGRPVGLHGLVARRDGLSGCCRVTAHQTKPQSFLFRCNAMASSGICVYRAGRKRAGRA